MTDPPSSQVSLAGLKTVEADLPINEMLPSPVKLREAMEKLKVGKVARVGSISAEMLKVGGIAWKWGLVVCIWKGD